MSHSLTGSLSSSAFFTNLFKMTSASSPLDGCSLCSQAWWKEKWGRGEEEEEEEGGEGGGGGGGGGRRRRRRRSKMGRRRRMKKRETEGEKQKDKEKKEIRRERGRKEEGVHTYTVETVYIIIIHTSVCSNSKELLFC